MLPQIDGSFLFAKNRRRDIMTAEMISMDQRTVLIVKLLLENDSVKTLGVSAKTISRHLPKVE